MAIVYLLAFASLLLPYIGSAQTIFDVMNSSSCLPVVDTVSLSNLEQCVLAEVTSRNFNVTSPGDNTDCPTLFWALEYYLDIVANCAVPQLRDRCFDAQANFMGLTLATCNNLVGVQLGGCVGYNTCADYFGSADLPDFQTYEFARKRYYNSNSCDSSSYGNYSIDLRLGYDSAAQCIGNSNTKNLAIGLDIDYYEGTCSNNLVLNAFDSCNNKQLQEQQNIAIGTCYSKDEFGPYLSVDPAGGVDPNSFSHFKWECTQTKSVIRASLFVDGPGCLPITDVIVPMGANGGPGDDYFLNCYKEKDGFYYRIGCSGFRYHVATKKYTDSDCTVPFPGARMGYFPYKKVSTDPSCYTVPFPAFMFGNETLKSDVRCYGEDSDWFTTTSNGRRLQNVPADWWLSDDEINEVITLIEADTPNSDASSVAYSSFLLFLSAVLMY